MSALFWAEDFFLWQRAQGALWGPFCESTNSTMAAGVHVSFADTDIRTRAAVSTVKSNVPPFKDHPIPECYRGPGLMNLLLSPVGVPPGLVLSVLSKAVERIFVSRKATARLFSYCL